MINRSTIYNNNATEENLHNKEPKKKDELRTSRSNAPPKSSTEEEKIDHK